MFKLLSEYDPQGDQPKAIDDLVQGIEKKVIDFKLFWALRAQERHSLWQTLLLK